MKLSSEKNRLYRIYQNMIGRCQRKYNTNFKHYGGRGIKVCDEWSEKGGNGVKKFVEWSLCNGYSDGLSLDRIDVNGDYSPDNCRWVGTYTQSRNRRNNVLVGDEVLSDFADRNGIDRRTMSYRYHCGKTGHELTKKPLRRWVYVSENRYSPREFSELYGYNLNSLQTAFNRGKATEFIRKYATNNELLYAEAIIEERG